jgi:hypothetical protein
MDPRFTGFFERIKAHRFFYSFLTIMLTLFLGIVIGSVVTSHGVKGKENSSGDAQALHIAETT